MILPAIRIAILFPMRHAQRLIHFYRLPIAMHSLSKYDMPFYGRASWDTRQTASAALAPPPITQFYCITWDATASEYCHPLPAAKEFQRYYEAIRSPRLSSTYRCIIKLMARLQ